MSLETFDQKIEDLDNGKKEQAIEKQGNLTPFDIEAIGSLEIPIKRILEQLKPEIDNGDYGLIIGEDASGRIPALMIGRILKTIYEKRGMHPPAVRFLAGKTGISKKYQIDSASFDEKIWDPMIQCLSGLKEKVGLGTKKALIVTEYAETGESITLLNAAAHNAGVPADIAIIDVHPSRGASYLNNLVGSPKIVAGDKTEIVPKVTGNKVVSGVKKENESLFSAPRKDDLDKYGKERYSDKLSDPLLGQQLINEAREVANELADRIAGEYLTEETSLQG